MTAVHLHDLIIYAEVNDDNEVIAYVMLKSLFVFERGFTDIQHIRKWIAQALIETIWNVGLQVEDLKDRRLMLTATPVCGPGKM